jgi:hypothetical protein
VQVIVRGTDRFSNSMAGAFFSPASAAKAAVLIATFAANFA